MWQRFYEGMGRAVALSSVAVDVQGASVARPWLEAAGATFPARVDADGVLAERFGLGVANAVLLFDERGAVVPPVLRGTEMLPTHAPRLTSWLEGSGPPPEAEAVAADADSTRVAAIAWVRLAGLALRDGDVDAAAAALDEAWRLDPEGLQLRKQRWALRNPERFYDGDIDSEWQREQTERGS